MLRQPSVETSASSESHSIGERFVEFGDFGGAALQDGIAVLDDLGQGGTAPGESRVVIGGSGFDLFPALGLDLRGFVCLLGHSDPSLDAA